jgi:hypothetical protein
MSARRSPSPILGYNHNLRHGGRVFHVQTEDSGPGYARLYTHLFFEGTILSSKKQEYDAEAHESVVRAAMQKLHKLMITELTHAEHDARIAAFFASRGQPATLADPAPIAAAEVPVVAPAVAATPAAPAVAAAPVPADVAAPVAPAVAAAPVPADVAAPVAPAVAATPAVVTITPAPAPAPRPKVTPKPVVVVQPVAVRRPSVVLANAADGVVVRRNVVINVGAGQPPVHGSIGKPDPPPAWPARARAGAHYAVRDGTGYVAGNRARAAGTPEAQSQPLASARDIRMPWETPAPIRIAPATQTVVQTAAADGSTVSASGKIRMPWDLPPAASAPEAFSAELSSDKSLDEVILEYLADDGETDER